MSGQLRTELEEPAMSGFVIRYREWNLTTGGAEVGYISTWTLRSCCFHGWIEYIEQCEDISMVTEGAMQNNFLERRVHQKRKRKTTKYVSKI
jgi:hypothetical protein